MSSNNKISVSYRACVAGGLIAAAMLAPARAQMLGAHPAASAAAVAVTQPAPACSGPAELARFTHPLRHTARRLASGGPLVIVAIGSSSTNGAGASSPAASYPSRLAVELKQRFPGHDITVLNRGVNGEQT
jgi:acyl-CoA thioesterase I